MVNAPAAIGQQKVAHVQEHEMAMNKAMASSPQHFCLMAAMAKPVNTIKAEPRIAG